jgi:hypothetical protein
MKLKAKLFTVIQNCGVAGVDPLTKSSFLGTLNAYFGLTCRMMPIRVPRY